MAIYAVLIALAASIAEMLSKYESKVFKDIINPYLFIYLAINGLCAYVLYHFLPDIAQNLLGNKTLDLIQKDSWQRVFIAAFGYLIAIRAKLLTIQDTPIGIEAFYQALTKYCLHHMNTSITNRTDKVLARIYTEYREVNCYVLALSARVSDAPERQREIFQNQILAICASKDVDYIKCRKLGRILLKIVSTEKELKRVLSDVPQESLADIRKQQGSR